MENKVHLWQGERIDDAELKSRIQNFYPYSIRTINMDFPLQDFLNACDSMGKELSGKTAIYLELYDIAAKSAKMNDEEIKTSFNSITEFMNKETLIKKLKNELGVDDPFEIKRESFKENYFEGFAPLGFLVHVAPSNVFTVSVLCLIEGLLTGNLNFLKTSSSDSLLPQRFFELLIELDKSDRLKEYIIIARFSSKKTELLRKIFSYADGISAWGSEESIQGIKSLAPPSAKIIEWGHKISIAYIGKEFINNCDELREIAKDICRIEQQACSSPQNLYIEVDSFEDVIEFAKNFAPILDKISAGIPKTEPEANFAAEITNVIEVAKAEQAMGLTKVVITEKEGVRIIVDNRKALRASPLFRTIWLKALKPEEIVETLLPMRHYLQTVGLSCSLSRVGELSKLFFKAGVLRINRAGTMLSGYIGEPHDGKYALREFTKRLSINLDDKFRGYSSMYEFLPEPSINNRNLKVLTKTAFQESKVDDKYIELIVKSGGSSGSPTYSYFTWDDYHSQMLNSAYGLYAAGLDPAKDSVINLFAAGALYGGFISFFTILEFMQAKQYPMGIIDDLQYIAETIVNNNINTIISAPSFIIKLFQNNSELFKKNRCVKKIFYGGEHFTRSQKDYLINSFGIEIIRSAAYGSNDAGPIGFQCQYCSGSEHHLLTSLQSLEILKLDSDEKARINEPGRIILTSKKRKGQAITRYEIGDIGRLLDKKCECGRTSPLFELLGRTGDVFKAGGPFLNYNHFTRILEKEFNYNGNAQIILSGKGADIILTLRVENSLNSDQEAIKNTLLNNYEELNYSAKELNLKFEIEKTSVNNFEFIEHSGKLKKIIDNRI